MRYGGLFIFLFPLMEEYHYCIEYCIVELMLIGSLVMMITVLLLMIIHTADFKTQRISQS
jgi:hypothetical protein